jgi:hypothetical protein
MNNSPSNMRTIFQQMYLLEQELWSRYRIRDQGQYAARLVGEAIGARVLANGVNKGFDLEHDNYGRIEVRSRRYPLDGRREDRAQVPARKAGLFDYFAHIVLDTNFTIAGGYLAPHDVIDALARRGRQRYVRFSDGRALPGAIDITLLLREAQTRI